MYRSDFRHFPDPQIEVQGQNLPAAHLKSASSVYLQMPQVNYGTR